MLSCHQTTMQAVNYGTLMKNIPYGGHPEYIMQLTHSTRKLTRHMRWAAKFKLDPTKGNYETKENFEFPSQDMPKLKPEHSALLKPFESKMADIITNMKFRRNATSLTLFNRSSARTWLTWLLPLVPLFNLQFYVTTASSFVLLYTIAIFNV